MSWPSIPLKRIAQFTAGGTPSVGEPRYWSDSSEGHAWVAIGDMSSVDSVTTTTRRVSDDGLLSARISLGEPGTILFSMYASLGHTAWLEVPAAWNQAILGIKPDKTTDARFLRYSLASLRPHFLEQARSNTQANLNAEQVGNIPVPRPPLDEQRRIADFLDHETSKVDYLIAARRSHQVKLDERVSCSLVTSFLPTRQTDWRPTRLKYLFDFVRGGVWGDDPAGNEWDLVCVRVADFRRDEYRADPMAMTLRNVPATTARTRILRPGDVLLEKSGGGDQSPVGYVVSFEGKKRSVCSNFVAALRVSRDVEPRFACLLLAAHYRSRRNIPYIKQTTGIQNLDVDAYLSQRVCIPTLDKQKEIAAQLDQLLKETADLQSAIDRQVALLAERRQALITAAVTGQIDVTTAQELVAPGGVTL